MLFSCNPWILTVNPISTDEGLNIKLLQTSMERCPVLSIFRMQCFFILSASMFIYCRYKSILVLVSHGWSSLYWWCWSVEQLVSTLHQSAPLNLSHHILPALYIWGFQNLTHYTLALKMATAVFSEMSVMLNVLCGLHPKARVLKANLLLQNWLLCGYNNE